jgi:hypothetical protein
MCITERNQPLIAQMQPSKVDRPVSWQDDPPYPTRRGAADGEVRLLDKEWKKGNRG